MPNRFKNFLHKIKFGLGALTSGPQVLALLPALMLSCYWIGGETLLVASALAFPALLFSTRVYNTLSDETKAPTALDSSGYTFADKMRHTQKLAKQNGRKTACFLVEIDEFDRLIDQHGNDLAETVMTATLRTLGKVLRGADQTHRVNKKRIGICLSPIDVLGLEVVLQLANRMQTAFEDPITIGGAKVYVTISIGVCEQMPSAKTKDIGITEAAEIALDNALQNGPAAIRVYSEEMKALQSASFKLSKAVEDALENGEIQAWFQPQISTDTGLITGFEALARWEHPKKGLIPPGNFLHQLQQIGKMERLSEVMLSQALTALKSWDTSGITVPHVGVNFSSDELRNPKFVDKVMWELDKFDLAPERLSVEILETVVATSHEDIIAKNINRLAELGCFIDLDDFGTGHASISSLKRFAVQRLKIDRSFVTQVDKDADQRQMVSAILVLAERLNLDTIAEGVETAGEHSMLSQLGCQHVQGFGIGRPMPSAQAETWISEHLSKLSVPPQIGRQAG